MSRCPEAVGHVRVTLEYIAMLCEPIEGAVMTSGATESLRADRGALLEICAGLSDAEWKAESGCAGWSVQDVVAHLGGLYWLVVDPSQLPDTSGADTEASQEIVVESRRSWSPTRTLEDYAAVSEIALQRTADLEQADFVLPLGDLGTYPAAVLPNAYAFDHYTHIRADLFAPRGPLTSAPPPSDELRLRPALDWVEAALPQQNAAAVDVLPGAVELAVTGTAARVITVGSGDVVATIESDGPGLIRWVTQRATWAEVGANATGDAAALAAARTFKVF
jgi:uncharacterized protein (TIGR03083 family)